MRWGEGPVACGCDFLPLRTGSPLGNKGCNIPSVPLLCSCGCLPTPGLRETCLDYWVFPWHHCSKTIRGFLPRPCEITFDLSWFSGSPGIWAQPTLPAFLPTINLYHSIPANRSADTSWGVPASITWLILSPFLGMYFVLLSATPACPNLAIL